MKKLYLFSILLAFAIAHSASGQQKNTSISFKTTVHDFGTIKEEGGIVSFNFEFLNSGNSPLVIQRVITLCDCTTSDWSKEPVSPNANGIIKVSFDPKNRPGAFDKTITVNTNGQPQIVVLQIRGVVLGRPKTIEENYSRLIGSFRFRSNHISFDRVFVDKVKVDTIEFISVADEPVKIGCKIDGLPHLSVKFVPETLSPKEKGLMIIMFDAKKRNDWGFVIDRFNLTQNGKDISNGLINISASIEENFSNLTEEEHLNAPKIEFAKTDYDFGKVDEGQVVEYEFSFTNNGKSDLFIRKIRPSCGCTTVEPSDKVVKPGKNASFKASVRTKGMKGRNTKSITVISNDPVNPIVILRLSGMVNEVTK